MLEYIGIWLAGLLVGVILTGLYFMRLILRAGREIEPPLGEHPVVEDAGHILHDYRNGHYRVLKTFNAGEYIHLQGRGAGVEVGHHVILNNGPDGETCYRITQVTYTEEIPDLWFGEADFDPRPQILDEDSEYSGTH